MACHIMDMPYWALDLKYPLSVEAEQGGNSEFPARTGRSSNTSFPPGIQPAGHHDLVRRKEGRSSEHAPWDADGQDLRGYESVLVGDKGAMVFNRRSTKWKIIGRDADEVKQIEQSTPQSVARVEQDGLSTQDANHARVDRWNQRKGNSSFQFRSCRSVYGDRFVGQLGRADR